MLLRDNFKEITPTCLPAAIFRRNRGLKGSLRSTHVKTYGKDDKTRAGVSKHGWRLVLLQGCPSFMKSLESYDEDERFALGSGFIYIRGGVRKPRQSSERAQRGRGGSRSYRGREGPRRSEEENRSYHENYPTITEETTTREDNSEARSGGTEGNRDRSFRPPGTSRQSGSAAWRDR